MIDAPRAVNPIASDKLGYYEAKGWLCQFKLNGSYLIVTVRPDGISILDRHHEKPKGWQLNKETEALWKRMPPGIFCAELLHLKVPGIRNTFYLHDTLSFDETSNLGKTYQRRHEILQNIFEYRLGIKGETEAYYAAEPNFWLAKNHPPGSGFEAIFKSLAKPEYEGVVLKNPKAILTPKNSSGWSVKCRRPFGNSQF